MQDALPTKGALFLAIHGAEHSLRGQDAESRKALGVLLAGVTCFPWLRLPVDISHQVHFPEGVHENEIRQLLPGDIHGGQRVLSGILRSNVRSGRISDWAIQLHRYRTATATSKANEHCSQNEPKDSPFNCDHVLSPSRVLSRVCQIRVRNGKPASPRTSAEAVAFCYRPISCVPLTNQMQSPTLCCILTCYPVMSADR